MGRPSNTAAVWGYGVDEPLEPDRCLRDRSAPCFYAHRKFAGLAGYALSDEDRVFVGLNPTPPSRDGWRYPSFGGDVAANPEPDPGDAVMLRALMNIDLVTPGMTEFLSS